MLKTYLNPSEETDEVVVEDATDVEEATAPTPVVEAFEGGTPISEYKPASSAPTPVKSAAAKFDELFEEDED